MRSIDTKSSAATSPTPIKSGLRLLRALTAIALACMLAAGAEAAERAASPGGPGGRMIGGGNVEQSGGRGAVDGRRIADRSTIAARRVKQRRSAPDEVLIQLASSVPDETIAALGRRLRLDRAASFTANGITTFRWKILDRRPVSAVIRSLEAEPIVLAAQPNYTYKLVSTQRLGNRRRALGPSSHGEAGQNALVSINGAGPSIPPKAREDDRDDGPRR